jgi:hypothetical protein
MNANLYFDLFVQYGKEAVHIELLSFFRRVTLFISVWQGNRLSSCSRYTGITDDMMTSTMITPEIIEELLESYTSLHAHSTGNGGASLNATTATTDGNKLHGISSWASHHIDSTASIVDINYGDDNDDKDVSDDNQTTLHDDVKETNGTRSVELSLSDDVTGLVCDISCTLSMMDGLAVLRGFSTRGRCVGICISCGCNDSSCA